jgi:hypothetical protein
MAGAPPIVIKAALSSSANAAREAPAPADQESSACVGTAPPAAKKRIRRPVRSGLFAACSGLVRACGGRAESAHGCDRIRLLYDDDCDAEEAGANGAKVPNARESKRASDRPSGIRANKLPFVARIRTTASRAL